MSEQGSLRPILFRCESGNHHVSRAEAICRDGEFVCPRHYQEDTRQQKLVTDGGEQGVNRR